MKRQEEGGRGSASREAGFILRHLAEGDVLLLGAGPGTLPRTIALAGHAVVSIESVGWMREHASSQQERLSAACQVECTILEGDLFTLRLDRTFPNVVLPGTRVASLGSNTELDALLATVVLHLHPDGAFIVDASGLWSAPDSIFRPMHWQERSRTMRRRAGRRLTERELEHALSRHRLVVRERYGDFDDRPATDDDPRRLLVAGFAD